jgi:flagellar export protein FliJ
MPAFKFRLATLQRLREAHRDERRAQLAEAYRADEILQEQIARLLENLKEMKRRQTAQVGGVNVDPLLDAHRYEMVLRMEQMQLEQQQQKLKVEIERRREALIAADRDVKVLEKLKETQHARFLEEEERRQMKVLDEIAGRTHQSQEVT